LHFTKSETFAEFTHKMYRAAMRERRAYKEKEISYEEYLQSNLNFLHDRFLVGEKDD